MFCPNCGAKNDESARFCEQCGQNLREAEQNGHAEAAEQPYEPVQPYEPAQPGPAYDSGSVLQQAAPKKMAARTKAAVAEALILVFLCFLCYRQIGTINNPETIVHKYMDAVMEQNWSEAYSYLQLPESPFLTAEAFEDAALSGDMTNVTNYRVEKTGGKEKSKDFVYSYQVQYMKKGGSQKLETTLQSVKKNQKKWLILDDWKISPMADLIENIEIRALPMMNVTVDGVPLTPDTASLDTGRNETIYTIPYLFAGSHVILVSAEGFEPYSREIDFYSDGDGAELELPYLEAAVLKSLAEQSGDYWNQVMAGIVTGETPGFVTEDLSERFASAQYQYDIGGNESILSEVELKNITASLRACEYDDGYVYAEIILDGTVDIVGQYGRYQGFGRPISYETVTESGNGTFTALYYQDGSNWVLQDFYADFR